MNQNFTKKAFVFMITALTLSITACDKKEGEVTPTIPDTPPVVEVSCQMATVAYDGETPISLSYDEEGYLSTLSKTETNSDGSSDVYTGKYIYDSSNLLVKQENYTNGKMNEYTTFEYKDGLLASEKNYEYLGGSIEDDLLSAKTYKYDTDKRVIELTKLYLNSGRSESITKYTYDNKGNVVKEESFNDGLLDSRAIYSDYDDKPVPYSAIKAFINFENDVASKNNPGKREAFYFQDTDGDRIVEANGGSSEIYKYEYNSNGFPIRITETDLEDSNSYITTFTYECK